LASLREIGMASEAQIAANRANAQRSTGPRTEAGKAASAQNGLKHGLCAKEAVLPYEERDGWEALLADLKERWKPVGPQETALVEEYAGCSWRLRRALLMEAGMLRACWPDKLQALADGTEDGVVLGMAMETVGMGMAFMKASMELSRLSLHESRIERRRERVRRELEALQAQRRQAEAANALLRGREGARRGTAPESAPRAGPARPQGRESELDQGLASKSASASPPRPEVRGPGELASDARLAA